MRVRVLRGRRVLSGSLYVVPNPRAPISPWVVGAKSGSLACGTQCHSGHINRHGPGCGLASASPQGVDDPFNTHVPAVTHSTQNAAPSWLLENPPGGSPAEPAPGVGGGNLGLSGAVTLYRNNAQSAPGEEWEGESRLSFPVLMAPVIEMPDCTCKSLQSRNVVL